ncbi:2'-deoxycytidine 5'-triphosphate deaminase, partial [bacterium]|nr:2'-deoxycytidine 5'-triphosphate deaminase [bacterium]
MILSDKDIKKVIKEGKLTFKPRISEDQISPASIDLNLGNIFKVFIFNKHSFLNPKKDFLKKIF